MESSHSDSPNNRSKSWECPPSARKRLIPDSSIIYARRATLRSAKKLIETRRTSVQAYQVSECSVVEPESLPRQVARPSTFVPEIRHEETENAVDSVAPEKCSVDVAEMEKVSEDEKPMANHSIQMEEHNAFGAESIPLEKEPLVEDIEAPSNSRESADKNNGKSASMVGNPSSRFSSLNLTEMINMWDNEGDDGANFVGQSSRMDAVEGYRVKPEFMPILRKILSKHGDVFKNSTVTTFRSIYMGVICDIISELQDKGLHKITEDELHYMIALANEMKNMKANIEWLHLRLEEILEARQILKQSDKLKEERDSNKKVIETVKRELEECEAEKKALSAKFRSVCDRESACKETRQSRGSFH
ncbi:Phospholipase protein [Spatholobus suberectus]|nr:Phospholipase protein [Spatholobus suberectus]